MGIEKKRENLIFELQSDLKKYARVILIIDRQKSGLCFDFCNSNVVRKSKQKILVLSTINAIWNRSLYLSYRQITEADCNEYYRLYHMYEFSDRFQILSREGVYGTLFNFIDSEIFNLEKVFEAFLC